MAAAGAAVEIVFEIEIVAGSGPGIAFAAEVVAGPVVAGTAAPAMDIGLDIE